jgi:ATP-dependent DNA helicase DinG
MSEYPPPTAFGLPAKFTSWRKEQLQAIERSAQSSKRFVCHALPTGSGKSLVGVALGKMLGRRIAYLTSTKGLQRQLEGDFGESGLVDIRGQGNYRCALLRDDGHTGACDHGPCHAGFGCEYRDGGCYYYEAVGRARSAEMVVTNYKYWVMLHRATNKKGEDTFPLGKFDMLILDEVHDAPDELSEALTFSISRQDAEGLLGMSAPWSSDHLVPWKEWAGSALLRVADQVEEVSTVLKQNPHSPARHQFKQLKDLERKLADLSSCRGEWIADQIKPSHLITFSPVWPAQYARRLFLDIPNVLALSATVRPKTARLLGIPVAEMDFFDYDSSFPVHLRPVIHVPTVRMNHKIDEYGLRTWLNRVDQIIRGRLDRKGIVHTVSYERRNLIMTHSDYLKIMLSHDPSNTSAVIEKFKAMPSPAVLVSPSVSTGFDFPDDLCRYQIIGKLAFIDTRNKLAEARCTSDPDYSPYIAMQQLVQACGRGMRSATDFCESLIIDDNIVWFIKKYKNFAPPWFLKSMGSSLTVPDPPKLFA